MYYDSNYITSVYFFDTGDNSFGSSWLLRKGKYCNLLVVLYLTKLYIVKENEDGIDNG